MEKISIGINRRIHAGALELALASMLKGQSSSDYFAEIAKLECRGDNRAKKMVTVLNRLTIKNKMADYMLEHKDEILTMLAQKQNKSLLFAAIMCSAYEIAYDIVCIIGKYLHVQPQVGRELVLRKLSEKYGSNHALVVAFDSVVPLLLEIGFLLRPKPAVYELTPTAKYSDAALAIYKQAFLLNNPNLSNAEDVEGNSFFEYTKQ